MEAKNTIAQEIDRNIEDKVVLAKQQGKSMSNFFDSVIGVSKIACAEDIDIAIHSLRLAGMEAKEIEARKRAEEEARIQAEKLKTERKRREAALIRAERRAEKKRQKHVEEVTAMDLPLDYENAFANDERATVQFDNAMDGLMMSLDLLGLVDIEFIASVTGKDLKTVIEELRGVIYQNPLHWDECFYKGWETAEEYLSGNIMHKYKLAKEASVAYNGFFDANVKALENVMEPDIAVEDIYITLGSPWVPPDIIDDFILHLLGTTPPNVEQYYTKEYAVQHDEQSGEWRIPHKDRFRLSYLRGKYEKQNYQEWGTKRMDMLTLLEKVLNMRTISIKDACDDNNPKKYVINHGETIKILEKQDIHKW